MLVHQPDVAASDDRSGSRFKFSGRDRRQRRLPRAVFPAERVDLAGKNVEVDPRDGVNAARIDFVDLAQLERGTGLLRYERA